MGYRKIKGISTEDGLPSVELRFQRAVIALAEELN
jgi:hypothetical protein